MVIEYKIKQWMANQYLDLSSNNCLSLFILICDVLLILMKSVIWLLHIYVSFVTLNKADIYVICSSRKLLLA